MSSSTLDLKLSSTALIKSSDFYLEVHGTRCSFCGLGEGQVARLFEGRSKYICNECIRVCAILLADYKELGYLPSQNDLPWYRRLLGNGRKKVVLCSFCGAEKMRGEYLLAGLHSQICERCIHACESINYDSFLGS